MASLANLVLVYGKGEEARAKGFWKVYAEVLAGLPRVALDRACAEYAKVGKFFPKPAEIFELAEPHAGALRSAAFRSRQALVPVKVLPPPSRPAKEDMAATMSEFLKAMAEKDVFAKTRAKASRPAPSARLMGGRAMSAEMAALLERGQ